MKTLGKIVTGILMAAGFSYIGYKYYENEKDAQTKPEIATWEKEHWVLGYAGVYGKSRPGNANLSKIEILSKSPYNPKKWEPIYEKGLNGRYVKLFLDVKYKDPRAWGGLKGNAYVVNIKDCGGHVATKLVWLQDGFIHPNDIILEEKAETTISLRDQKKYDSGMEDLRSKAEERIAQFKEYRAWEKQEKYDKRINELREETAKEIKKLEKNSPTALKKSLEAALWEENGLIVETHITWKEKKEDKK